MLQILLAFIGGVLTIAAPCIILPLPIILGASTGQTDKRRPLFIALGFTGTFAILGISLNFLIQNLGLDPNVLRLVAVILLAIFAVFMIWPEGFQKLSGRFNGIMNKASSTAANAGSGVGGGLLVGAIIGIIWAPCAGPILASILTLIAQEKELSKAALLLVSYSIGAGVPMLLVAYGGQAITTKIRGIAKYSTQLEKIFGVILLLLAFAIYFQYDTLLQAKIVEKFPSLNSNIESTILGKLGQESKELKSQSVNLNQPITNTMNKVKLDDYGIAPDFKGITKWLNSDPLTMEQLKGKVVLIDFWTYSCINCIRTLPYVTKWYDTYKDQGFVVIGVHAPEFAFEKETENVKTAIKRYGINYPVAQDNDMATWNNWENQYWPAHYLVDQQGKIRYYHFGEGKYDETENAIRQLLNQPLSTTPSATKERGGGEVSPEMYFGLARQKFQDQGQMNTIPGNGGLVNFKYDDFDHGIPVLAPSTYALDGQWNFDREKAESKGKSAIYIRWLGKKLNIVASSKVPQTICVVIEGKCVQQTEINEAKLYEIYTRKDNEATEADARPIKIEIPNAGLEAFTFTFGN